MKTSFILFLFLVVFLFAGCTPAKNPPKLPANEVAPGVPYLWPKEESSTAAVSDTPTLKINDNETYNSAVARIDDTIITLKEFDYHFAMALRSARATSRAELTELYQAVLDSLIDRELLLRYADEQEITVTEDEVDRAVEEFVAGFEGGWAGFKSMLLENMQSQEEYREQVVKRSLILNKLTSRLRVQFRYVAPGEVLAEYERSKDEFQTEESRKVFLIIAFGNREKTEDIISNAKNRLEKGEDFATVARDVSEGPKAEEGGDQGWVKKGELASDLAEAIFSMREGEVKSATGNSFSFIAKLEKIRPKKVRAYEEVQEEIRERLMRKAVEEKKNELIERLKRDSTINTMSARDYIRYRMGEAAR